MENLIIEIRKHNIDIDVVEGQLKLSLPNGFDNDEMIDKIRRHKTSLISFIESKKKKAFKSIEPASLKSEYRLSSTQKRLYFLNKLDKSRLEYNMPSAIKIIGKIDIEKIEDTFSLLIDRHEILRTSFHLKEGEPVQRIHKKVPFKVSILTAAESDVQSLVEKFVRPFDIEEAPLFKAQIIKLSLNESILLIDMHHIISDGVSQGIFINEFIKLYSGQPLSPLKLQNKDYAEWQQNSLKEDNYLKGKSFWLNEFEDRSENLELPYDLNQNENAERKGDFEFFIIETEICQKLEQLAAKNQTTLFNVVLSMYAVLLSKLGNQQDTVIGVPVAGRQHKDLEGMMGVFINTLALRNKVDYNFSFTQLLNEVKTKTVNAFEHQDFPYDDLVDLLKVDRSKRNFLFDAFFSFENFGDEILDISELRFEPWPLPQNEVKFDFQLTATHRKGHLGILFSYTKSLFTKETIARFADYFKKIASVITYDSEIRIKDINLLLYQDVELLNSFNETARNYDTSRDILARFREQVALNPERIAVKFRNEQLTYKELDRNSNKIAHYLISKNIGKDSLVPLLMERSLELITAILGVLKAGAAYVPVDPEYPQERIDYILNEVSPKMVFSLHKFKKLLSKTTSDIEINFLDKDSINTDFSTYSEADPGIIIDQNSMAYVIYTSGTTGNPKGVINNHAGILNRLIWMCEYLNIGPEDKILQKTTYCFDVSVWELLLPLISGARLVFCEPGGHKDISYLKQLIEKEKISVIHFVSSMLSAFLSDTKPFNSQNLKHVICSGEELKRSHVSTFKNVFDNGTRLYNFYGPTEAAIDVTATEITDFTNETNKISIGSPVANTSIYIVDRFGKLQPPGVKGELVIGGIQVARGYFKRDELTSEKFDKLSLGKKGTESVYRTGDLARWLPDGSLKYLGRIDMQVKVRGNRIEPGEIENTIEEIDGVSQAVVTVQGEGDLSTLVAYYTGLETLKAQEILDYLQSKLPSYMLPAYFKRLDKVPVTASGKVNRKALPVISLEKTFEYVKPETEVQEKLVEIWADILKSDPENISITSSFFEMGGNSLSTLRMVQQADVKLGISIPVNWVFEAPTIKKLSGKIQDRYSWTAGFDKDFKNLDQSREVKIAEIEKSENLPPLFICSPLGGIMPSTSIIGILDMAPHLKDNISFYGVQAPALFPDMLDMINEDRDVSLKNWDFNISAFERIVEQTANTLIEINGFNSYQIGGFCSGCVLAVEVTRRLKEMGRQVEKLVLIDPPLWMIMPNDSNEIIEEYSSEDIAPFITNDLGWNTDLNKEIFIQVLDSHPLQDAWKHSRNALLSKKVINEEVREEDIKRAFSHKFFNDKALSLFFAKNKFRISRISESTSVLLLTQEGEIPAGAETLKFISDYIASDFQLDTFCGNHHTLFQKENLKKWVAKVSQHLKSKKNYSVIGRYPIRFSF